jgi:hypothetical protein
MKTNIIKSKNLIWAEENFGNVQLYDKQNA